MSALSDWGDVLPAEEREQVGGHDQGEAAVDPPADEPPPLYYATLDRFVEDYLVHVYARHVDGRTRTWCPRWWAHAEAVARLEALWRAWEHLRHEPALGASTWWRDHADPHMAALTDPDHGPWKHCSPDKGHSDRLQPLPAEACPAGLFAP